MLAIIPARKNSKTIKKKSFKKIGNKSLIEKTIFEAKKSRKIKKILVTSDDPSVLIKAKKRKVDFIIKRSKNLCKDTSTADEYLIDVCKYIKKKKLDFKNFILLQPTSPLRTYQDIDKAILFFEKKKLKNLISVTKPLQDPSEMVFIKNKKLNFVHNKKKKKKLKNKLRQSYFETFFIDGSIYIINIRLFEKTKKLIQNNATPYQLDKLKGVDINDISDLKLANALHKFR